MHTRAKLSYRLGRRKRVGRPVEVRHVLPPAREVHAIIHSETGGQGPEASGIIVSHDEQVGQGLHSGQGLNRQIQALPLEFVTGEQDYRGPGSIPKSARTRARSSRRDG